MTLAPRDELSALSTALRELILEDYEANDRLFCDGERAMALFRLKRSAPQALARTPRAPKPKPKLVEKAKPQAAAKPKPAPRENKLPETPAAENSETRFTLERPQETLSDDFVSLRSELHELFPHLKFLASPPDDAQAKAKAEHWKRKKLQWQALILADSEHPEEQQLLQNLCTAINRLLVPAGQLNLEAASHEGTWERIIASRSLRLILGDLSALKSHSRLQELIQGDPPQLGELPILELGELEQYLTDPEQKKALWKSLKELLGS